MRQALALAVLLLLAVPARADMVAGDWIGRSVFTSRPLTFAGPWEVRWTANGHFAVQLLNGDGKVVDFIAHQLQPGSGSSYVPHGGTFLLRVTAESPWQMRAVLISP